MLLVQQQLLQPGEFKIYGNKTASLAIANLKQAEIYLYPNPATELFHFKYNF
jgi:hypothetical protein